MPDSTSKQIKTLLVEDSPEDVQLLKQKLNYAQDIEFNLTHVDKLQTAVKKLQQEPFDVILLDLTLPDSQGIDTFLTLEKIVPNLPIILLTDSKDESLALTTVRQGAQDYLFKEQITVKMLLRSINYAIERMHYLAKIHQSEKHLQQVNKQLAQEVRNRTFELEQQNRELKKLFLLATTDQVTGIANRHCLEDFLNREWGNAIRNKISLSVIMIDIDRFKVYNDTYGHSEGDLCLWKVAQTVSNTIRRSKDLVARYGGEEFVVVLPNVDCAGAMVVTENIRTQIKALNIPHRTSDISDRITVSLGISSIVPTADSQAISLIRAADRALYSAKQKGRDRLEIAQN